MSFIIADDPDNLWQDPESPTVEQIEALIGAYKAARAEIDLLRAEIARLNGEQEVVE